MTKAELRDAVRGDLRGMSKQDRAEASSRLVERLRALPQLLAARVVAAFWPLGKEPDVRPLLATLQTKGIRVLLPRWLAASGVYEMADGREVVTVGPHGAGEPAAMAPVASAADLAEAVWLVPGLAFDVTGNRLGRGGGYYDRLLAGTGGVRIGVAFHQQVRELVPAELHDMRMQVVVSDRETIDCTRQPGRPSVDHLNKESAPWNSSLDLLLLSSALPSAFLPRNLLRGTY
jgi:5-formyltetrahydrofolate cyclo-ligase